MPVADFNDAVGIGGDLRVVGDDDHGMTFGVQFTQDAHDLLAALAVQCAGWLVGKDDFATVNECAGNTDALLLATGELVRPVVFAFTQTQLIQQGCAARASLFGFVTRVNRGDFYVAHGIQIAEQVVALKNKAKIFSAQASQFVGLHCASLLAIDPVTATRGAIQTAEDIHQSGFARAGLADDGDHFPRVYAQIDVV